MNILICDGCEYISYNPCNSIEISEYHVPVLTDNDIQKRASLQIAERIVSLSLCFCYYPYNII